MTNYVDMKTIIVKSAGTLPLLSGVAGPILTPFRCKVDTIGHLINTRKEVYEVLEDGTEIKLDKDNFNKENYPVKKAAVKATREVEAQTEEAPVEEVAEEEQKNTKQNFNKNNNFKNKK